MSTPQGLGSFQTLSVSWAAAAAAAALVILLFLGFLCSGQPHVCLQREGKQQPKNSNHSLAPKSLLLCLHIIRGCSYNTQHMVQHQGHLPLWALLPSLHSGEGQTGLVSLTQLVKTLATMSDRMSLVRDTNDLIHASCPLTSPCTHVNKQNMKFIIILLFSSINLTYMSQRKAIKD